MMYGREIAKWAFYHMTAAFFVMNGRIPVRIPAVAVAAVIVTREKHAPTLWGRGVPCLVQVRELAKMIDFFLSWNIMNRANERIRFNAKIH